MEATVILCDFAEAINGKLYVMGGGWNTLFAPGQPVNIALGSIITVPWDRTEQNHEIRIELIDSYGEAMVIGDDPVVILSQLEVGRPPGVKPGTSLSAPVTSAFNGLTLDAGLYEFKLSVNGDVLASRPFTVQDPPDWMPDPLD
ncbi:MAG TPA: hypothetical protein VK501_24815 [Baekduia sp.]|uniref:DUF6941 family protein n=1 Tax=Baekduia sp. TaxID=2600305 RepID=UPI002BFD1F6C|nr:hypothetical protein [Baekduia sp.]HMJ37150.1 hypothetical protein [Baekduia sp.]